MADDKTSRRQGREQAVRLLNALATALELDTIAVHATKDDVVELYESAREDGTEADAPLSTLCALSVPTFSWAWSCHRCHRGPPRRGSPKSQGSLLSPR